MVKVMSGSPEGRPEGSRNRTALISLVVLDARAEARVQKMGATARPGFLTQLGKTRIAHAVVHAGAGNFFSFAVMLAVCSLLFRCYARCNFAVISL